MFARSVLEAGPQFSSRAFAALEASHSESIADYQQALKLWLAWSQAEEAATAAMFAGRHTPGHAQALLDDLDALRRRAIQQSRELL